MLQELFPGRRNRRTSGARVCLSGARVCLSGVRSWDLDRNLDGHLKGTGHHHWGLSLGHQVRYHLGDEGALGIGYARSGDIDDLWLNRD